ncbi:hypothetical protein ACFZCY_38910 [Streptomyces sp. NPDC007983]|uniref:hypothetical protein n=1 Tax=Streptomyces sp. NPDC007983 TaxID=3364800 RepID=UPI0036EF5804
MITADSTTRLTLANLRIITSHWGDLHHALATTGTATWPPPGGWPTTSPPSTVALTTSAKPRHGKPERSANWNAAPSRSARPAPPSGSASSTP